MRAVQDDEGRTVSAPARGDRIVSLVPSLTEAVARTAPGVLVGATDWCTHPAELQLRRIRGTKNPEVGAIIELQPDLVLANKEENRRPDLDTLRAAGLPVYVTDVRSVEGAFTSLRRMLEAARLGYPAWLREARQAWDRVAEPGRRRHAVVPIWRRPWRALGSDTFAGDVLRRLGVDNVLAGSRERYPRFTPAALPPHDLVVLPDEPYAFTAVDGPEAFPDVPTALISGRLLTWYGPSLIDAAAQLPAALHGR
ncbi:MAG TPA: helical backbone metal receptor [Pseudonocardiaceae bacterium]|jgi:ABC-type Fe3+-hydroxamate transport system substrate-binding protein